MTKMTPDERDSKTLLKAAEKIRSCSIPHIISEDRWTARPAVNVIGVRYANRPVYDLPENGKSAFEWLFKPIPEFYSSILGTKKGRVEKVHQRLRMAQHSLSRTSYNGPDAVVDGNVVHWMEHAIHIALWSPVVTEAVAVMLEAESKAVLKGERTSATPKTLRLAREINKKKTWDSSPRLDEPAPTFRLLARRQVKSIRKVAIARLRYMQGVGVDTGLARLFYDAYGYETNKKAMQTAQRLLRNARKASVKEQRAQYQEMWEERIKACNAFIEALQKEKSNA